MIIELEPMTHSGLYVVEFPQHVKVGRSANLLTRIGQHAWLGGQRAWLSRSIEDGLAAAEAAALRAVAARAGRDYVKFGMSESFPGLSFSDAVEVVQNVVDALVLERVA